MFELSDLAGMRRRRITFPPPAAPPTGARRALYLAMGLVLFPFHWLAGAALGAPGMRFRFACFRAGFRLLLAGRTADAYHCIVSPLDSVRHFEVEFFWRRICALRPARVLDVSSPRLLPLLLLRNDFSARADLVNPDHKDLARTRAMADGLGVGARCCFIDARIDALPQWARGYPLVTCMSVLEHVVDDLAAVRVMWDCVAPGGCLLMSLPCTARAMEEFTNVDEYGLLDRDDAGFVFWQRYYDEASLQAIFSITGPPAARALYAEREPGVYDADVLEKRTNPFYPRWREPLTTARSYAHKDNIAQLSGMGVIALEFIKPAIER